MYLLGPTTKLQYCVIFTKYVSSGVESIFSSLSVVFLQTSTVCLICLRYLVPICSTLNFKILHL